MNQKGPGRKRSLADVSSYTVIYLEGMKKTTIDLSHDSRAMAEIATGYLLYSIQLSYHLNLPAR
jgi:hypothetical protein